MSRETNNFQEDEEIIDALQRYEEMLKTGELIYFDVFQIEHIIDSYIEEGKLYPALQVVNLGLKQHPASINILSKKANILLNLGETSTALTLVNNLLLIEETNPELYILKGSAQLILGEIGMAEKSFHEAIRFSFEDKLETLYSIGYTYEQCGNFQKAIQYFYKVHLKNPLHEAVLYELAYCYEKIGEDYKCIQYYNKYLDLDTFSDTAWFNMGIVYNRMEKHRKAAEAYEYALTINEDFPNSWYNLGNTYIRWKKFDKAIPVLQKYLEFDKENDEIHCMIGDCFIQTKKYDLAFTCYQQALIYNKNNDRAWFGSGLIMKFKGDFHAAWNYLKKAVKIDEKNSDYWFFLAKVSHKLNLYKDTTEAYETVCELAPGRLSSWLKYAEIVHQKGMIIQAISILESALGYHPSNSMILYRLAAYHLESLNEENAIKHLKKALTIDYNHNFYLFESYPEAQFNDSVRKLISKFKKINS
jgi:tetratricopeptide (TPR) repeat protein